MADPQKDDGYSSPLSSPPDSPMYDDSLAQFSPSYSDHGLPVSPSNRSSIIYRIEEMESPTEEDADDPEAEASITARPAPAETDKETSAQVSRAATKRKTSTKSRKAPTSKKPRRSASGPKKPAKDRKWEAPGVYADPKSPLASADLRAMLLLPGAWDALTPEEQKEVLALFPDQTHILDAGTENARPNIQSLRNDDNFRSDCARYCENIELGRHDEEWLSQAWAAHEKHRRGDFNDHLDQKFEEDWEVELPEEHRLKRPRESMDSVSSDLRRVSGASTASERTDTSPAVPRKLLDKLSLANTPPGVETDSPQDDSPGILKRKRDRNNDDDHDDTDEPGHHPKKTSEPSRDERSVESQEMTPVKANAGANGLG